jgi:hypothetical protein
VTLTNTIVAGNFGAQFSPLDISGVVDPSSSFNLIGDAASSGGLIDGTNNNIVGVANPWLAPLGDYGGPTQTVALLPGSPALDAGGPSGAPPATDQRGQPRVNDLSTVANAAGSDGRDIGAFESRGFVLSVGGGSPQSTTVGQPFAAALDVTLTANDQNVPLGGIPVTFTPPASGAAATLSSLSTTFVGSSPGVGDASVTATANGVVGSYSVAAAAPSTDPVAFDLTNTTAATTTTPADASATFAPTDQTVTLSATVTSAFGTVNGGSVTFTVMSGTTVIGTPVNSPVASGAASTVFTLPGGTAAGNLSITADYDPGSTTFAASSGGATLTIGAADQTIAFTLASPVVYGAAPITLTATATSGLPVSYALISGPGTLNGNVLTITGAGSIVVQADQAGDANNNPAPSVQQTLLVTPAPLTITANDVSRFFGHPNPPLTASFNGFVNGETAADLTGTLVLTTSAVATSPPGAYPIIPSGLTSSNYAITFVNGTLTVNAIVERVAIGAGPGGGPRVLVLDGAGNTLFNFFAYDSSLRGGVSVATADVTGDGIEDVITGAGVGGGTDVKVFDGVSGQEVASWFAYGTEFRGGVWVAAGDVNGDGTSEVITGAGSGGGPVVEVWSLATGSATMATSFLAFDAGLRGGVTVAYGRDAAGSPVIVAGEGPGGAPSVRTFDAVTHQKLSDVFAFDQAFSGGVFVATGDVLGNGSSQVLVGPGAGGGPRLEVLGLDGTEEANLFAAVDTLRNGLTVAAMAQSSGPDAILIGAGEGAFEGELSGDSLANLQRVGFFTGFQGGVFVG